MTKITLFAAIFFGLASIGLLISTIVLSQSESDSHVDSSQSDPHVDRVNVCKGAKAVTVPAFNNLPCNASDGSIGATIPPQAGSNVTLGYKGEWVDQSEKKVSPDALRVPYAEQGLCPVNVHWHLGTEHISQGQYDETGTGPTDVKTRRKLAGKHRQGGQCMMYDKSEEMYTKKYDWKHCDSHMEVGQTYEVHWPHSIYGACNTPDQYQTPFYDGVFCRYAEMNGNASNPLFPKVAGMPLPQTIGVQAQVFVIVNDETYYNPDLIRGMIVDADKGTDIAYYTGSTTGTSRNNEVCSAYGPITWQVDRTCHQISASSFDKMCMEMKSQFDDMSEDLEAHGSRIVVNDNLSSYADP